MRIRRMLAAALIAALTLAAQVGCSDYRELEEMLIVMAAAVDCDESGCITLTAEILRADGASAGASNGTSTYTARGRSVAACELELRRIAGGELYWGHAESLLFSQSSFEPCFAPLLDWALRDNEARLTVVFAVSGAETAAELLAADAKVSSAGEAIGDLLDGGGYADAKKMAAAVHIQNQLNGGDFALLPLISISQSTDYRKESGGGGGSENSDGGDMSGMDSGSGDTPDNGGVESDAGTVPRLISDGAAVVCGSPARIALVLSDAEVRALAASYGKINRSGYVIESEDWVVILEDAGVRTVGGTLELRGNCRVAQLCGEHPDVGEELFSEMAQAAARILEQDLSGALERVSGITGEPVPDVRAELTIVNIGLISE